MSDHDCGSPMGTVRLSFKTISKPALVNRLLSGISPSEHSPAWCGCRYNKPQSRVTASQEISASPLSVSLLP